MENGIGCREERAEGAEFEFTNKYKGMPPQYIHTHTHTHYFHICQGIKAVTGSFELIQ